jgi:hypothetical protein
MSINTQQIESIFDSVSSIVKKYDDMALQSGEKFNVFDIIGLRNDEVRMHSAMLANLLDAQGSHGMKGKFLELFIKTIEDKKSLDEKRVFKNKSFDAFDSDNSYCIKEEHNYENGRIDLVIKTDSGSCPFLIENKIYAREQDKQLINYNNAYSNAKILFLTLYGTEPISHKDDNGNDLSDKVYCISYKTDVLKWLESCQEEVPDKPLIREGIKHYINLIKILTNQTTSELMKNEILNFVFNNNFRKEFYIISELKEEFLDRLCFQYFSKIFPQLNFYKIENKLHIENCYEIKKYKIRNEEVKLFLYLDKNRNAYIGLKKYDDIKFNKKTSKEFKEFKIDGLENDENKTDENDIYLAFYQKYFNEFSWELITEKLESNCDEIILFNEKVIKKFDDFIYKLNN